MTTTKKPKKPKKPTKDELFTAQSEREARLELLIFHDYMEFHLPDGGLIEVDRLNRLMGRAKMFACDVIETFHQEWLSENGF